MPDHTSHRVRSAKPHGSAPKAVTTTQCGVVCSMPPPAQSSGTRRPTVRSQSLAALQRIVCSYLFPGSCRLRSVPASLRRVMAQAAWPSGAAHLKHDSRQRPTALHIPSRCHASCSHSSAQAETFHATREVLHAGETLAQMDFNRSCSNLKNPIKRIGFSHKRCRFGKG